VIQEIIPGDAKHICGFNAYYNKNFTPNGVFMYRRIREWPPVSGNGVLIENVGLPEIEEIITPLVKKIKYYGIVDAEFKKDPRSGMFNLIEINPRCWIQVGLPLICGANLPYIAYLDALGKDVKNITPKKEHAKWMFMFQDTPSSLKAMINGEYSVWANDVAAFFHVTNILNGIANMLLNSIDILILVIIEMEIIILRATHLIL